MERLSTRGVDDADENADDDADNGGAAAAAVSTVLPFALAEASEGACLAEDGGDAPAGFVRRGMTEDEEGTDE